MRAIRKLVSLPPETAAAVERFRNSDEMKPVKCPTCGRAPSVRGGRPSESDALRRLIEIGLDHQDGKAAAGRRLDAIADAVTELNARGATWTRAHIKPIAQELIVEGWRERPQHKGELPI